jgi:hypothetical protein
MQISKDQILQALKSNNQQDKAEQAEKELPDQVDTDKHADLLDKLGIDPKQFLGDLGGGLPNL